MPGLPRKLGKRLDKYTWQCYNRHNGDAKYTWQSGTYGKEAYMNRDEILEKARKENKGHDLAEQTERRKNWQAAFIAAIIAAPIIMILQFMTGHDDEAGAIAVMIFAMDFGTFLRQAIKKRNAFEIGMTLVFGVIMVCAAVHYIQYLTR